MGEAHNDTGIELAKALCEQSNWPLKPVSASSTLPHKNVTSDLIVSTMNLTLKAP